MALNVGGVVPFARKGDVQAPAPLPNPLVLPCLPNTSGLSPRVLA